MPHGGYSAIVFRYQPDILHYFRDFCGKTHKSNVEPACNCRCPVLLGTWIFFDPGESAFVIYAGLYLVIGIVSMLFSSQLSARKRQ